MAERISTITLRVVDQFSAALDKFNASLGQAQGATAAISGMAQQTAGATQRATTIYDQYGNVLRTTATAQGQATAAAIASIPAQEQAAAAAWSVKTTYDKQGAVIRQIVSVQGEATSTTQALTTATTAAATATAASTGRTADATRASTALGAQLTQLGRGMMSTFTGFIAGVAAAAALKQAIGGTIQAGLDFDQAMRQVNTVAQLNDFQFQALSKEVKEFTRTNNNFLGSAKDAANALNIVVQAGVRVEDGLTVLKAASVGATAGFTDIKDVTQALIGIMNAYGESANRAMHNTNVLAQTVAVGVITWQQLTQYIGEVVQTAAATKQPIEVVGAAIATMTQKGIQADLAVTALNRTFLSILSPSAEARKLAAELGIEWNLAALESKGLVGILTDMMAATHGNAQMVDVLTGDIRAFRGILALTNDEGARFNENLGLTQDAQKGVGAAQEQADEALKAYAADIKEFRKQVNLLATELAEELLPTLIHLTRIGTIGIKLAFMVPSITLPDWMAQHFPLTSKIIAMSMGPLVKQPESQEARGIREAFERGQRERETTAALAALFGPPVISAEAQRRLLAQEAAAAEAKRVKKIVPEFGQTVEFLTKPHEEAIKRLNEQLDNLRDSSSGAGDATRSLRRALREQQDVLRENGEQVRNLEERLRDLRRTLDDLARPRLIGAGVFEEQVFQLEQQIREARLAELQGGGDEGRRRDLERQLEILRLQREIFVAPVEFAAGRMVKPPGPEMAPEEAFQRIREVQQAILETEVALAASKASYELNQVAVENLTRQMDSLSEASSGASEAIKAQEETLRSQIKAEQDVIAALEERVRIEKLYQEYAAKSKEEQAIAAQSFLEGLKSLKLSADDTRRAMEEWQKIFEPGLWNRTGISPTEAQISGFQGGGIIPGSPGAPRLVRAEAGELILNRAQQRALAGAGAPISVSFNSAFPPRKEDAEFIMDYLEERLQERNKRTQGGLLP